MINWEQIEQLQDDIGAEDFSDVVQLFLAEVDEAMSQLQESPPDNPQALEAALHFLKGSAYNLGFRAFGNICSQGESNCRSGQENQVDVPGLVKLYSESKECFFRDAGKHCSL